MRFLILSLTDKPSDLFCAAMALRSGYAPSAQSTTASEPRFSQQRLPLMTG